MSELVQALKNKSEPPQTSEKMWQSLRNASLVIGDYSGEEATPWYLNVLLAICGWLAACLCVAVIALSWELLDSLAASLIVGLALIATAYACLRPGHNQFVEHLAIALSFTGQWLVFLAFEKLTSDSSMTFLLFALLQIALVYLINNFLHSVVSSGLACASIIAFFNEYQMAYIPEAVLLLSVSLLWLNEFSLHRRFSKVSEVAYGIVLVLISLAIFRSYSMFFGSAMTGQTIAKWLTILTLFYVIVSVAKPASHELTAVQRWLIAACVFIISVASAYIYGVALGVIILLLGFHHSNRILIGLGIICLLSFISRYYYFLDVTLLEKAKILAAIGITLLVVRLAIIKLIGQPEVSDEA